MILIGQEGGVESFSIQTALRIIPAVRLVLQSYRFYSNIGLGYDDNQIKKCV